MVFVNVTWCLHFVVIWQVAAQPDVKFVSVDEVPADLKEKAAHRGQSMLALSTMQRAQRF